MKTLSPYTISWVIIEPVKGVVTQHDRKMFGELNTTSIRNKQAFIHFANRSKALEYLKGFDKKLDKKYMCRIITDAQFGKIKVQKDGTFDIPYTQKQLKEVYHLG